MAGKITELAALTGAAAATSDLIETLDVSDTSMNANGTNKKMTLSEMVVFLKANGTGPGIVQQTTAPTDTTLLWADTATVGIEENARYFNTAVTASTYTLVLADRGKMILANSGSAQTITVPTNATAAFVVGTQLDIVQMGAGVVSVIGAAGVTVNGVSTAKALRVQYSAVSLIKTATNTWIALGDLA